MEKEVTGKTFYWTLPAECDRDRIYLIDARRGNDEISLSYDFSTIYFSRTELEKIIAGLQEALDLAWDR